MTEQPKGPEKTIYQRDKTAKEPTPLADTPKPPTKPKPKIKKGFCSQKSHFYHRQAHGTPGEEHSAHFFGVCENDMGYTDRLSERSSKNRNGRPRQTISRLGKS